MHSARKRFAQHDAAAAVVAQLLEGGGALLALRGHLAHADLVADHLDRFLALDDAAVG